MKRITTVLSTIAFTVLWLALLTGQGDAAFVQEPEQAVVQYPNNSCLYRGVVVGKFVWTGYETDNQVICDFGSLGVWVWDSGTWTQISGADPDRIIGAPGFLYSGMALVGDFGSMGLWKWESDGILPGAWDQISGQNPSYMFIVNDNGDGSNDLHAAFPGYGLWRMDGNSGQWTALSTSLPLIGLAADFWAPGWQEGVHSFGPLGVWYFGVGASPVSGQLSAATAWDDHAAADFGVGGGSVSLIMDFGPLGTWLAEDVSAFPVAWHQLSSFEPLRVKEVVFAESGNLDCELLCAFKSAAMPGLWYWDYTSFPGTWTNLRSLTPGPGFCEPFNVDGASIGGDADDEVAVDFDGMGLMVYNFQDGSWVRLSSMNPVFMVRFDLAGIGVANCLVVDFGAGVGLWCYDGAAKSWFQLTSQSPDELFDTD